MAITRNALLTFAFALTVAASARTAAAGAAKEIMAPANLKPEAARGFERLKGVEITDGEITVVDYGKGGLRVAFVLRPTPKSFIRCELGREIGIGFKELENYQPLSAGINLYALKDIPQELEKVIGRPFVTYSYHEQYFHKDYLAYQPDYADKVMLCARMLHDAGYKYIFFADLAGVN